MSGYMGKCLKINLTESKIETFSIDESIRRQYIGGCGLGAYYLLQYDIADKDALDPSCPLIIMTGPLTDTKALSSGRHDIVAKSPLTGIWGEASAGGYWGSRFKRTGHDGIIITGRASSPVYILIEDEKVQIKNASMFWGLDTYKTGDKVKEMYGKDYSILAIGTAGEKLVPMANIMHGGREARAAGRGGLGAVMGSKMLKMIIVKGTHSTPVEHPEKLKESTKAMIPVMRKNTEGMTKYGTISGMDRLDASQDTPIKNWTGDFWTEGATKLSGQYMAEKDYYEKSYYCAHCVIGCGKEVNINERGYTVCGSGPEYETCGLLGSSSLVDDVVAISYANELCNSYGIDTMGVGASIAFAREAYEKGHYHEYGINLNWGSVDGMIELVHQIGRGEKLGKILGKGTRYAAQQIGGNALDYAMQVKGSEMPAHDPRSYQSVGLGYATSNRGACHLQAWSGIFEGAIPMPPLGYDEPLDRFTSERKPKLVFDMQNLMSIFDSLTLCKYVLFGEVTVDHLVEWLNLVTGWDMDLDEFMMAGERIFNTKRQFNVECGISAKDDILPKRILTEPRKTGPAAGMLPKLDEMLPKYYKCRGWDMEGRPTLETLNRLGIKQNSKE